MAEKAPILLSGGNPQIPKRYGDAPLQAYIMIRPGWKSGVWARLDTLIERAVPGVAKAAKWNSPLYGPPGQGDEPSRWFSIVHCFDKYIKIAFFRGQSLGPVPPVASKSGDTRYFHIHEADSVDETAFADWVKRAAALPAEKM